MFAAAALLAFAALARAQNVLFEGSDFRATLYYDIDQYAGKDVCSAANGGPFQPNWAIETGINEGYTMCQGSDTTEWTLKGLDSNRIVAMNYTMLSNDKAKWCGKEVQIFDSTGAQIILDEGPFVLFDGCAACMGTKIIDISAKAFAQIKGGTCAGNNPEGLTVKIMDNVVSPSGRVSGGSAAAAPVAEAPAAAAEVPAASPSAPAVDALAAEAPSAAAAAPAASSFSIRGKNAWWISPATVTAGSANPEVTAAKVNLAAAPVAASEDECEEAAEPIPAASANDACEYGKWQCAGKTLQVCNRATSAANSWETVSQCPSECSFTSSGSVICQ